MVCVGVVMMPIGVMMVRLPLYIYDLSGNSQSGRSFVFKKLCNVLRKNSEKQKEEQNNKYFHSCTSLQDPIPGLAQVIDIGHLILLRPECKLLKSFRIPEGHDTLIFIDPNG